MKLPAPTLPYLDPNSGRPLVAAESGILTDGRVEWPVVAGIPYLRTNRDRLRREALDALAAGDERRALVTLLADQDDFARIGPPSPDELHRLVDAVEGGRMTLRAVMEGLNFGPVADYFAYRWSSPTYLSGLMLLDRCGADPALPVVEVACGIGHYLRDLARRGRAAVGADVVFAKLWLARRFLVPDEVPLVCGDVAAGFPLGPIPGGAVAFCHDAFYFLPDKPRVIAGLRQMVGPGGSILIGHAHNRDHDHGGVAGEPKTPAEYESLLAGCRLYDDAELARSAWTGADARPRRAAELAAVEAVAMVAGPGGDGRHAGPSLLDPVPGTPLRLNPLLVDRAGVLEPRWPSDRFRAEYEAASGYLTGESPPAEGTLAAAADGAVGRETDPEVDRLARRRVLLDLPERWGTEA